METAKEGQGDLEEAVRLLIAVEQEISDAEGIVKAREKDRDNLHGHVLFLLQQAGISSAQVKMPEIEKKITVSREEREVFHAADKEAFFEYVFDKRRSDLITSRVGTDGVKAIRADTGELPPGVASTTLVKLSVRRNPMLKKDKDE